MLDKATEDQEMVTLDTLAEMTGFPVEMIRTELFSSELAGDEVSLTKLREAMVNYIDATMLKDSES